VARIGFYSWRLSVRISQCSANPRDVARIVAKIWIFKISEFYGYAKSLICLAPRAGFEPATNRLTAGCSTTELPGNSAEAAWAEPYNKRSGFWPAAIPPGVVSTRVVRFRAPKRSGDQYAAIH
jgi:hypothetical protein